MRGASEHFEACLRMSTQAMVIRFSDRPNCSSFRNPRGCTEPPLITRPRLGGGIMIAMKAPRFTAIHARALPTAITETPGEVRGTLRSARPYFRRWQLALRWMLFLLLKGEFEILHQNEVEAATGVLVFQFADEAVVFSLLAVERVDAAVKRELVVRARSRGTG